MTLITNKTLALSIAAVVAASLTLAACSDDDSGGSGTDGTVQVSATTTQLADIAAEVGGDRAEVNGILAANSDAHDYEPQPSDAEGMTDADLVIVSGGDLDLWAEDLMESSGTSAEELVVLDQVETIEGGHSHDHGEHADEEKHSEDEKHSDEGHSDEGHSEEKHSEGEKHSEEKHSEGDKDSEEGHSEEGHSEEEHSREGEAADTDPHWWQNPQNAVLATEAIRDALIEADPDGAEDYESNAAAYIERLEELDAAIAQCMEAVPEEQRKLVTSHDALGYFADRYDVEVVGAAVPALSTQAQPSAGETAELVELIESENVNAVFPEAGLNSDLEQAIADDAGAAIGDELWADTLGPEGSGAETYIDAMSANATSMVEGFTAGEQSCEIEV